MEIQLAVREYTPVRWYGVVQGPPNASSGGVQKVCDG
jgi:hypothetical protein